MAAHVLTGTKQILADLEQGTLNMDHIKAAVNLSCFTEDNVQLWEALNDYVEGDYTDKDIYQQLKALLPSLEQEWSDLGKPATREEWLARKYWL